MITLVDHKNGGVYKDANVFEETAAITTVGDAPTTLWRYKMTDFTHMCIMAQVAASGNHSGAFIRACRVYRTGGLATLGNANTESLQTIFDDVSSNLQVYFTVNGNDVFIMVEGIPGDTVNWVTKVTAVTSSDV